MAFIAVAAALLFVTSMPALCPTRALFHVPCPSCGLTRAARLVFAGRFGEATRMHPLWMILFPYLGALLAVQLGNYVRRGTWDAPPAEPSPSALSKAFASALAPVTYVIVALLVVVWVARFFGAFGGPVPID